MLNYEGLERFDQLLQDKMIEGIAPGLNVALVTDNEIWKKSYGFKQLIPTQEINSLDVLWDLASLTKVVVTTTCIIKLIEEGVIELDTPISSVFTAFEEKTITVKECITHTSALPPDVNGYKDMTLGEMETAICKIKREEANMNKVVYSDVNFILLGKVIEICKGSLTEYAKEVIFTPLKMVDTCFNPAITLKDRCAAYEDIEARGGVVRGVVHDGKAYKLGGVSGHAGCFSTIEDMSHFVDMLIHDGYYEGKEFFSAKSMELLKTCNTEGLNERRSLGWVLSDPNYPLGKYHSDATLYHTGFSGPSLLIDLDRQFGCIILCNRVHPTRDNKLILDNRKLIHESAYNCLSSL